MHEVSPWVPRAASELERGRAEGIAAWQADAAAAEAAAAGHHSREDKRDAALRTAAHEAEQRALDAHPLLVESRRPRLVLVHTHGWLLEKLGAAAEEHGLEVQARFGDGASAVGAVVALQPDVVLVGEVLTLRTGPDVLTRLTRFAPGTRRAGLGEDDRGLALLQEAGAEAVWGRRAPVGEIAAGLARLVGLEKGE